MKFSNQNIIFLATFFHETKTKHFNIISPICVITESYQHRGPVTATGTVAKLDGNSLLKLICDTFLAFRYYIMLSYNL